MYIFNNNLQFQTKNYFKVNYSVLSAKVQKIRQNIVCVRYGYFTTQENGSGNVFHAVLKITGKSILLRLRTPNTIINSMKNVCTTKHTNQI